MSLRTVRSIFGRTNVLSLFCDHAATHGLTWRDCPMSPPWEDLGAELAESETFTVDFFGGVKVEFR
eukprot:gene13585-biopygen16638